MSEFRAVRRLKQASVGFAITWAAARRNLRRDWAQQSAPPRRWCSAW